MEVLCGAILSITPYLRDRVGNVLNIYLACIVVNHSIGLRNRPPFRAAGAVIGSHKGFVAMKKPDRTGLNGEGKGRIGCKT